MTLPLFSKWVCDYCSLPEDECEAAKRGLSITLIDAYAPPDEEE
jgi:hypothetical protein